MQGLLSIIYLWYMFTTPTDLQVCSMWISRAPTANDIFSACGALEHIDILKVQALEMSTGKIVCEQPALELPKITCDLFPLDHYRLNIIWPGYTQIICTIKLSHDGDPLPGEIASQCPNAPRSYNLKYQGTQQELPKQKICTIPDLVPGPGLLDLPGGPDDLVTKDKYYYLAAKLLWYGISFPNCNGWSGIDPETGAATTCGMDAALPNVLQWQNRYNASIYRAGYAAHVPPKLLKRIIAIESQFWPLWKQSERRDEVGLIQLTDNGADTVFSYSPEIFSQACPLVTYPGNCINYSGLNNSEKEMMRYVLRNGMIGSNSPYEAAMQAESIMNIYADVLTAFYCYSGEVAGSPSWEAAMIIYHAGAQCWLTNCLEGQKYLERIKQ